MYLRSRIIVPLGELNNNTENTTSNTMVDEKRYPKASTVMKRKSADEQVDSNPCLKRSKFSNKNQDELESAAKNIEVFGTVCKITIVSENNLANMKDCIVKLNNIHLHQESKPKKITNSGVVSQILDTKTFANILDLYVKNIGKEPSKIDIAVNKTPISKFVAHTQDVLNKYNFDMKARLDLDYVLECNTDLETCVKTHGKTAPNSDKMADYFFSRMFTSYAKLNNFEATITYLRQCVIDVGKCPATGVVLEVFELILNMEEIPNAPSTVAENLQSFADVFEIIITEHPPHAYYMMRYYKELLTKPLNASNINIDHRTKYDRCSGIFHFTLKCLEMEFMKDSPQGPLIEPTFEKDIFPLESSLSWDIINEFEINETIKKKRKILHLHEALDRKERIHRLFTLLKIMVKLLELDLASFTLIYGDNHEKRITKKIKPIIAELLWPQTTALNKGGFMNSAIRQIIKLFMSTVKHKFPKIYMETLTKLLSVVIHAVNLHEPNSRRVFPYISVLTNNLAIEITHSIRVESPDTVLQVLQIMKPAFMKSLIIDNLLQTITSVPMKSITSYYALLKDKKYLQYKKQENTPSKSVINKELLVEESDNYENLIMLKNKITQKHFLQLIYLAITAYVECYKIHDFNKHLVNETISCLEKPKCTVRALVNNDIIQTEAISLSHKYSNNCDLKEFEAEIQYNLRPRKDHSFLKPEMVSTKKIDFVQMINSELNQVQIPIANQLENDVEMSAELNCKYYRRCRMLKQLTKYCSRNFK